MIYVTGDFTVPENMSGTEHVRELAGLKVLLVDDHRDAALTLARLLESLGCEADACFDAATAIDRAAVWPPDVVVLDIRLPDMPGTELCSRLRGIETLQATTFVALTGAADHHTLGRVRNAGFDWVLTKPAEFDDLLEVLRAAPSRS